MPFFRIFLLGLLAAFLAACDSGPYEEITPPSPFHGIHGLAFDDDDNLLAGSVLGRTIYNVHPSRGYSDVYIGAPEGMADDIAVAEDGTIAWTAYLEGKIYAREPGGEIKMLAEGLPGANSLDFHPSGKLYATQVFLADALYEIDREGKEKPRLIRRNLGGLNGFEFGDDGLLYGPLWFKKQVISMDVENPRRLKVIARDFGIPAAVNIGPNGALWVVDTERGEVVRVDRTSGEKSVIARVKPAIDNLAFNEDGELFISNMADNAIIEIDIETGEADTIISGVLAAAADIAITPEGSEIYVADVFSLRKVDTETGEVSEIARVFDGSELEYPINVAVGSEHVAVTSSTGNSVHVFDRATGRGLAVQHEFNRPHGIVILPDGDILVAEHGRNAILRLSGRNWAERRVFSTRLDGPASIALSAGGESIYVTENNAGRVTRINLQTRRRALAAEGLDRPEGIAVMGDGTLIVAEVGKKRLVVISEDGSITPLAEDLPIGLGNDGVPIEGVDRIVLPTGVAVDADGQVYFSSDIDVALYRLNE